MAGYLIEIRNFGRKMTIFYAYCVVAIMAAIIWIVHFAILNLNLFIACVNILKFSCCVAFLLIFPFTSEIFETNIRGSAVGFMNMTCRISAAFMPFIVHALIDNFGI